jgi:hypothetical protein
MQFLKFWWEALWASLTFGWVVFGIVSTGLPAAFTLLIRYSPKAGNVDWIRWSADHQTELHVSVAAIFVLAYFFYAPYKVYKREHSARVAAEAGQASQLPNIGDTYLKLVFSGEGQQPKLMGQANVYRHYTMFVHTDDAKPPYAEGQVFWTIFVLFNRPVDASSLSLVVNSDIRPKPYFQVDDFRERNSFLTVKGDIRGIVEIILEKAP